MLTVEQLEERMSGIGGSEAPAVAGIDTYRQPLDVWMEKTKRQPPADLSDKEQVLWGNLLEDLVAREWARRGEHGIRRNNLTMRHPDFPQMLAHIDRKVVGERAGLEVKTRGTFAASDYGPNGTDQVKETDIIQCQHYMGVTGYPVWHMAVLVGGQELRSYVIPRDQGLIDSLIDVEYEFWRKVQADEQPDLIYAHQSTDELLKRLYPGSNGQQVMLPPEAVLLHQRLDKLNKQKSAAEKEAKALRRQLQDMQGEAAIGLLPDGSGGFGRKQAERKGYTVEPTTYWVFRFSAKHKQEAAQ